MAKIKLDKKWVPKPLEPQIVLPSFGTLKEDTKEIDQAIKLARQMRLLLIRVVGLEKYEEQEQDEEEYEASEEIVDEEGDFGLQERKDASGSTHGNVS